MKNSANPARLFKPTYRFIRDLRVNDYSDSMPKLNSNSKMNLVNSQCFK